MALFGIPEITHIVIDSLRFLIEKKRIELHVKKIEIFKSYTARVKINEIFKKQHKKIHDYKIIGTRLTSTINNGHENAESKIELYIL